MFEILTGKRSRWAVPAALTLLAAVVQVAFVGRQGLWVDEIFSLAIATGHSLEHRADAAEPALGDYVEPADPQPAATYRGYLQYEGPPSFRGTIRAAFLSDTNPPLYYILLQLWLGFAGTSDAALRLFSVGWSIACVPLIMALGRRFGGIGVGVIASVLFIFCPISLYYSTEGRMYSLLWFCVLAVALLSLKLNEDENKGFGLQCWWVVASAAGLLVHYFFVFPWLAITAFLILSPGRDRIRSIMGRVAAVLLLVLPWYWWVPASLENWRITQDWLNVRPPGFQRLKALIDLPLQFFLGRGQDLWRVHRKIELGELAVYLALAGAVLWRARGRFVPQRTLLLWVWFGGAVAGPVIFDLLRHTYTLAVPRYAITAVPAGCLLISSALLVVPKAIRSAFLGCIVLGWTFSLASIYHESGRSHQPIREAAEFVSGHAKPDDLVLVQSIPSGVLGIARYATFENKMVSWVEQLGVRKIPESADVLMRGHPRIIFLKFHLVYAPAPVETWLRTHFLEEDVRQFGSITVTSFRRR